jgi:hypothetical protein
MTSYLRSWLYSGTSAVPDSPPNRLEIPDILKISPPPSEDEDEDDDTPPAFPALSSAQRLVTTPTVGIPRILTGSELMPPPPIPGLASRQPGVPLQAKSSPSSSLAPPPSTTKAPTKRTKLSRKVALAPGHSPLDWANLKASGQDLRVR